MDIIVICDKINTILYRLMTYVECLRYRPVLLKMSLGGVRATVSVALPSGIEMIPNMDKYCIIVIHNLLPEYRNIFS